MGSFALPSQYQYEPVPVTVVGAGGTGGEVMDGLARLHFALKALGHEYGLDVTLIDDDVVSESNIGRQRFSPVDVGHPKADLLIHRINLFYGLSWSARVWRATEARELYPNRRHRALPLLIGCVDNPEARRVMHESWEGLGGLWLDYGNGRAQGQVVLGYRDRRNGLMLPSVMELFPSLWQMEDDNEPSCSAAAALREQSLFMNRTLADTGLALLYKLFTAASIEEHGALVDVDGLTTTPLPIDPAYWSFLGYEPKGAAEAVA